MKFITTKSIVFTILVFWAIFLISCFGSKEEREMQALSVLGDCADWIITKGIGEYYKDDDFDKINKYIKNKGAYFYTESVRSVKDAYLAGIDIQLWWIVCGIKCYVSQRVQDDVYEYWVISYDSKRTDFSRKIQFIITKAASHTSNREIINQSTKFYSKYSLPDDHAIKFPIEKKTAINILQPWRFPQSFVDTALENLTEEKLL